jgi:hypothetical protein
MSNYKLITVDDQNQWIDALESCGKYDTYHLPEYHLLAKDQKEGTPFLFCFQDTGYFAAFPFLLRQISDVQGLEGSQFCDVTSVYGYPGIVTNIQNSSINAKNFRNDFQKTLLHIFHDKQVIAFFTRQNPLFQTSWLFHEMGDIQAMGKTVAIDLSQSSYMQDKNLSINHKRDIRKAKESNIFVYEDKEFKRLDDFILMYNETMKRNSALEYYFFPKSYYNELKRLLDSKIKLFIAEKDGIPISAAMFLVTGKIIHYHLSGTPERYLRYSGLKIILYEVQRWGASHGYKWLHLGGGLGATEDSLFRFKSGFSKLKFSFEIIKAIIEPQIYNEMVVQKNLWIESSGHEKKDDNYFPTYRAPVIKKTEICLKKN